MQCWFSRRPLNRKCMAVFSTRISNESGPAVTLPECSTWNIVSNCCMATGFREPHSMKSRKGSTRSTRRERTSSRPWGWIHGMALPDCSRLPRGIGTAALLYGQASWAGMFHVEHSSALCIRPARSSVTTTPVPRGTLRGCHMAGGIPTVVMRVRGMRFFGRWKYPTFDRKGPR